MAADNKLELVIQLDAAGANASIKSVNTSLSGLAKTALSSARGASQAIEGMAASMAKAVVVGKAIYDVGKEAFQAIKEFTRGAMETAAVLGKTAQKVGLAVEQEPVSKMRSQAVPPAQIRAARVSQRPPKQPLAAIPISSPGFYGQASVVAPLQPARSEVAWWRL